MDMMEFEPGAAVNDHRPMVHHQELEMNPVRQPSNSDNKAVHGELEVAVPPRSGMSN